MTVVEHELKRYRALQEDVSKKKKEGVELIIMRCIASSIIISLSNSESSRWDHHC